MRILHPSPVNYIQQSNNTNTTTATTNSVTLAKRNDIIGHLPSSTEDYTTDLSNLNGNPDDDGKYSYGLIDADDNVNLTISSSHNLSARYIRTQNHQNHSTTISNNRTQSDTEKLCNNLNQLNNLKSNSTGQKLNGNDNDIRQLFQGNLNVLEVEQETSTIRSAASLDSSTLSRLDKTTENSNISNSKSTSNITEEEEEDDDEEEEEGEDRADAETVELESSDEPNLICNEYHHLLKNKTVDINDTNSLDEHSNNQNAFKVSNSVKINLSSPKLRQNLAKLDLERNLQNSFQNPQLQQNFSGNTNNKQNQLKHTYKRGSSVSPIDHHQPTSTGRGSEYSSSYSCETSPDDSFMEDEDAYSPSPSSNTSLTSPPEPSNFPRGIINPNYPGFQHLAHTLSEHFVNHSDADDSDLSEFEVELSVESLDESFERFHSNNCNNNNSINNNNNNNNNDTESSEISSLEMMSSNDELNYNLESSKVLKESRENKSICLPDIRVSSSLENPDENKEENQKDNIQNNTDPEECSKILEKVETIEDEHVEEAVSKQNDKKLPVENISCDLDTLIKTYETSSSIEVKTEETDNLEYEIKHGDPRNCPTPDILIKNGQSSCRTKSTENRPDLLRNVSVRLESIDFDSRQENRSHYIEEKNSQILLVPGNIPIETKRSEKDDGSYGVTPVDIIGDFGREVEREFGLIVSGYNTRTLCRDYSPSAYNNDKQLMIKTADAELSNAKEQLHVGSGINTDKLTVYTTCDLLQQTSSSSTSVASGTLENQEKISNLKMLSLEHNNLKDETPSSSKVITKNSLSTNNKKNNSTASCMEKLIPTAIVKPKYQKSSYDDRQLPPIGLGYCDYNRAWYESKCNSSQLNNTKNVMIQSSGAGTSGNDQRSRKTQQQQQQQQQQQFAAHFDRNSKFSRKFVNRSSLGGYSTLGNSKLPNTRRFEKDTDGSVSVVAVVTPRKKDKMETNLCEKKCKSFPEKNNNNNNNNSNNNSSYGNNNNNLNCTDLKKKSKDQTISASFDVYNIETALPVIDLEAIENHLKKAKEEERKRRNDREEIRRRLAMGAEDDYFSKIVSADRPGRKPSLQSRLQSGMNLQICFMNDASSDTESPSSDSETCPKLSKAVTNTSSNLSRYSSLSAHPYNSRPLSVSINGNNNSRKSNNRPSTLSLGPPVDENTPESDFFTKQARLQIEARMALAQAKDMAHMQMEIERQKQKQSPITEVIRNSLEKVGVPFPPEKRRVSRQMLTDMNIAQLQIIVNELHTQIERLNEQLVQYLMERDELHMSQDSMLVDIEDLTRYLGAKEQSNTNENIKTTISPSTNNSAKSTHIQQQNQTITVAANNLTSTTTTTTTSNNQSQSKFQRIASLVKK